MLNTPLVIIYGALCAAAVLFAAASPRSHRRVAVILGAMLLLNWVLFILSYTPYGPVVLFHALGIGIKPTELWAIIDGICGVAALGLAWDRWWGWALWLSAIGQETIHFARYLGIDPIAYTGWLDNLLRVQLAIFFLMGGPGVRDFLHRGIARLRFRRGEAVPAHARARNRADAQS